MKKKYRLKKWVKVTLKAICVISALAISILILVKGVADYGELAEKCDQNRGYTCTHYDIRQFSLGK